MAPRALIVLVVASGLPLLSAALAWTRHAIPLQGELVLTDVHAIFDAASGRIVAIATGEAGVVLKLDVPAEQAPSNYSWTTLLDTSFPLYWYGAFVFSPTSYLISGFYDGNDQAYGIITFSDDGGLTWQNDTRIDAKVWGGGPIEFANATEGYMMSTAGDVGWRTTTGGRNASEWVEVAPSTGNWFAGNFVYDKLGYIALAGSTDCSSTDFGVTWACGAPVDASGMDSAKACAGLVCLVGGGEISPDVLGWVHLSTDGGSTYMPQRALQAPYPVRNVQAVASGSGVVLIAAGGNVFSGVGGILSSTTGLTWAVDIDLGEEVKSCRSLPLPAQNVTRVFCVSAGSNGGSIVSADAPM